MKWFLLFALVSSPLVSAAETSDDSIIQRRLDAVGQKYSTFKTNDGRILENAVILKVTDAGISIRHEAGTTRLRYPDLDISQRKFYGLKADSAENTYRREQVQQAAYEEKVEKRLADAAAQHAKFAELQRVAAEKLQAQRAASFTTDLAGNIPEQPTVTTVLSSPGFQRRRSFRSPFFHSGFQTFNSFRSSSFRRTGTVFRSNFRSPSFFRGSRSFHSNFSRGNFRSHKSFRR